MQVVLAVNQELETWLQAALQEKAQKLVKWMLQWAFSPLPSLLKAYHHFLFYRGRPLGFPIALT